VQRSGDEIAQDELVMLIGGLMNKVLVCLLTGVCVSQACPLQIWAKRGIEARLVTFRAVSVGKKVGFIEVVPNCTSLGQVQGHSLSGAFQRGAIKDWLEVSEFFVVFCFQRFFFFFFFPFERRTELPKSCGRTL
jgi:hypothetical protein